MQKGLTFHQAPPVAVPLSFFLTAPCFAMIAGALLFWVGPEALQSRWSPHTLALTHLVTLGFMAMTMIGALAQLLPVVAGSPLPLVVASTVTAYAGLMLGTALLATGLWQSSGDLLRAAVPALGLGFGAFLGAAGYSVCRSQTGSAVVSAIRLALIALFVTVILGATLATALTGGLTLPLVQLTNMHATWGLLGWVALLVMGVSFQVVPMFQATPAYPDPWARWLPRILFAGVALGATAGALSGATSSWAGIPAMLALIGFAFLTLRLQSQRRRRQSDTLLWFWRIAALCLMAAAILWSGSQIWPQYGRENAYPLLLGSLLIAGFAYATINGMLYKIVPFLLWFRLQSGRQGRRPLPNLKEILPDRTVQGQLWSYCLAFALLVGAVFRPDILARPAGLAFVVCSGWLWFNLMTAWTRTRKGSERPATFSC
jgi:hypothetical protein